MGLPFTASAGCADVHVLPEVGLLCTIDVAVLVIVVMLSLRLTNSIDLNSGHAPWR